MADRRGGGGADCRRQSGCEDEARGVGTNCVDKGGASGDVASHAAEGLGQRSFDYVHAVHGMVTRGDSCAARAIHANRMDLVEIGHGAVSLGEIADAIDRGDIPAH